MSILMFWPINASFACPNNFVVASFAVSIMPWSSMMMIGSVAVSMIVL